MAHGESLSSAAPVSLSERLTSIDVLRGVAVLGILTMNIPAFAYVSADFFNPTVGGYSGIDRALWIACHFLFDMKMMSIFSMLFGAGIILMSTRAERALRRPGPLHYRRMGWLLVFGLIHAYFLWYGDILVAYALCGMIVYPLRNVRPSRQIIVGLLVLSIQMPISLLMGGSLVWMRSEATSGEAAIAAGQTPTSLQQDMMEAWPEAQKSVEPPPESIEAERNAMRGTFSQVFAKRAQQSFEMQTFIFPIWMIWRISGLMLIGMALMKLGMFSAQWEPRRYARWLIAGYAVGLPLVWFGWNRREASGFDVPETFAFWGHFNYVGSVLIALAHVSLVMLWFRSGALAFAQRALAAVGRTAFSNYILQSLICTTLFYGYGFGLFSSLERWQLVLVVLGVWALNLTFSALWLSRFRYGPLEWLWRSLTYASLQPMRFTPALNHPG